MRNRFVRQAALAVALACIVGSALAVSTLVAAAENQPNRPTFHFTPSAGWINDPTGLVYLDGTYHLYYQANPSGMTWGNMSWGHATSTDLRTWTQQPLAIEGNSDERIFSGSVVIDAHNTSGLGSADAPPLVAVYTSWYEGGSGDQAQSLAVSLDQGTTWRRYAGNPVLEAGPAGFDPREFRDPKVFWHEPTRRWVMALALPSSHRIAFYTSPDLKTWTFRSTFGAAGATGGQWEVPDLFPLPLDGKAGDERWVLLINLNDGAINGGSGTQYVVGMFDGATFRADSAPVQLDPGGRTLFDFEGEDYGPGWTATGNSFGTGPSRGAAAGQRAISGVVGTGLVNSFAMGGDRATGTLNSPTFTIDDDWLNLRVGGGRTERPRHAGGGGVPPGSVVLADFDSNASWIADGAAATGQPTDGNAPCQEGVRGYLGSGLVNTFTGGCSSDGDVEVGRITLPEFTVGAEGRTVASVLLGGGSSSSTAVRLLVDGQIVRTASGRDSGQLNWISWDLGDLVGRRAQIVIVDEATGPWGHVLVDQVVLSARAAAPVSEQTSVDLVVDGRVVRSASGRNSEALDEVAWDVRALRGKRAWLRVTDAGSGWWGHVLLDEVRLSPRPATSAVGDIQWLDYGADHYAAVSWAGLPPGRRTVSAWMSNWVYAGATPTEGYRGAIALPRDLALRTIDGRPTLVQTVAAEVTAGRVSRPVLADRSVISEEVPISLTPETGRAMRVDATIRPGTATRVGLRLRSGPGESTYVDYDVVSRTLGIDRRTSGQAAFAKEFAGVDRAPLDLRDGTVKITAYVDATSIEVFGNDGLVSLTDSIFANPTSTAAGVFADNGTAQLVNLTITPMH